MTDASEPNTTEPIWFRDPAGGLLRPDRLAVLIPRPGMPLDRQLNAVMRFALCYAALLLLFQRSIPALVVVLVAGAATVLLHRAEADAAARARERMDVLDVERDRVTDELRVRPTPDNPFMNVLVGDVARFPNRPPAADVSDPDVARRVEANFDRDLYRDASDVFHRHTSSRTFYTTPSTTIPNDQAGFASWLYATGPTCKQGDGDACYSRTLRSLPEGGAP